MIQNQEAINYFNEQDELTKQISQFRRINASLKRKIQARDKKISYLFSVMEPTSKSSIQTTLETASIKKNRSEIDHGSNVKKSVCCTQPKNKEKQNLGYLIQQSIFKSKDLDQGSGSQKLNLKLPTLQRKNIFLQNPQGSESKPKIVKIAIQKLIPLKHQQVKKKFQSKFK